MDGDDRHPAPPRRFQRRVEDFVCQHCGQEVRGRGYTNHCPSCLHSRHVDVNPGDRASDCGGLMEPVAVESGREGYILVHRCLGCGLERRNRTAPEDNFTRLLEIARQREG